MQNSTDLLHIHLHTYPLIDRKARWKNIVQVCNRSHSTNPGGFICNDEYGIVGIYSDGLKEELNTLTSLSLPYDH